MPLLLDPVRTSSRTGWGAALIVGVGALLPAALVAPPSAAHGSAPPRIPRLAQDAVFAGFGKVAGGRGKLRLVLGPLPFTAADRPEPARAPGRPSGRPSGRSTAQEQEREPGQAPAPGTAPATDAGPCGDAGWFSPAPGAAVSQAFGVSDAEYAAGYHTGVDFAVLAGTPLLAIADAVVEIAGWGGAYGHWIVLRLPDGHFALYAHMSRLDVRAGEHVPAGDRLGLSGESGNARGPHLHFEIRTTDRYGAVIDPLPYLRAHRCRM